ncbi:MAG: tetratricopeptide repeat protein, partial [Chloroflexi bacterium]|nr:tetratricopeptide repeat protein [Chloroflexota bacterium]
MYLRGSKWSMTRRRRPINFFRLAVLLVLIGAAVYVNQVVVPTTPPLFIPTPTPTRDPESYVADAEQLFTAGKLTQAIDAYKQAIKVEPNNASNYVDLARIQIFMRDYQNALANAENALLINPNNPVAMAYRGWAMYFLADYSGSEVALQKALELDPNNALAHAFYAELEGYKYTLDNDPVAMNKAIEESRLARDLGPNLLETHRARALVLDWTDNKEEAVAEFQAAIAINKNIAELHVDLGTVYVALGDDTQAIEEFNQAIPLNPTDPLPLTSLARTYMRMGEYAKGIQYAIEAVKNAPTDPYMYGNLGSVYYSNKEFDKSAENLRLAVRGGTTADGKTVQGIPLDYTLRVQEYYNRYGLALARTNQCGDAIQIANALLNGVPNDETSVYNANEMIKICQDNLSGKNTPFPTQPSGTSQP